jgi:adenosylcobinamide-GDP ribazoletransferase
MLLLPQARAEGLAASAGRPERKRVTLGLGFGLVAGFLCLPPVTVLVVIAASLVFGGCLLNLARRQIGGITGDVLGGLQQLLELACLAVIVATATTHTA